MGKLNNLKVFGSKFTRMHKEDNENTLGMRFIDLSIYKLHHLGTVNFKYVLYIFIKKHANVEAISNKRIVPSMSYNSESTQ